MSVTGRCTRAQHEQGTWREGRLLQPASAGRRWWARILDGLVVLLTTAIVAATAMTLHSAGAISLDASTAAALLGYPVVLLVLGALYGCTASPGQALMGVVSLQTAHGRRVGFWRGMGRYLAVGFFPLTLIALVWSILDMPHFDSVPVRVYRRIG